MIQYMFVTSSVGSCGGSLVLAKVRGTYYPRLFTSSLRLKQVLVNTQGHGVSFVLNVVTLASGAIARRRSSSDLKPYRRAVFFFFDPPPPETLESCVVIPKPASAAISLSQAQFPGVLEEVYTHRSGTLPRPELA